MKNRNIPFGYMIQNGHTVANENEATVVSYIFDLYIKGKTLKEIAETLSKGTVTYFGDEGAWNKNQVSRILDDMRYVGNDTFPMLVDSDNFNLAKTIRAGKSACKIELPPLTLAIKERLRCSQCGKPFKRINKWKTREKWLCTGGCKCDLYLDDNIIKEGIQAVLSSVSDNPAQLNDTCERSIYEPSDEVIRQTKEISRLMEQKSIDFKRVAESILACSAMRYKCCEIQQGSGILTRITDELAGISELDERLIKKTIEQIRIDKEGKVTVIFKGNIKMKAKEVA